MPVPDGLTHKQESFCQAYIQTGNASEAYRRSYSAQGWKPNAVEVNACKLLKNAKVQLRIRELAAIAQRVQEEKFSITIETLTSMLLDDRKLARELGQASSAVTACKTLAQLHGILIDKKEIGKPGEFAALEEMSDADLESIARGSSGGSAEEAFSQARSSSVH